ncbi:unnamed protein product [Pelagomonas calceolata]|uniref:RING-CH-type domain-containing protein n=1 Tax=Pelagomonas calceolata TaxID=35677 RepID=A0A8J2SJ91_9STRA|nr:unnamed protein product [Pelagomonas calceolata]
MAEPELDATAPTLPVCLLDTDFVEQRYQEALAGAIEACAADTAGEKCYICYAEGDEEGLVRGCSCRGDSGIAHVSCLVRGAHAAVERHGAKNFNMWHKCGLCEQDYHGIVACALGWACWRTCMGRPEKDLFRLSAITVLYDGLCKADNYEDAVSVQEAELCMLRRLGYSESHEIMLAAKTNLSGTYTCLGLAEQAVQIEEDIYSGRLKLNGEEHEHTLTAANNYAIALVNLERFAEARSLMCKTIPVARRVFGASHYYTLRMKSIYAATLYKDTGATLDDLRESVETLEKHTVPTARHVMGRTHPVTQKIEDDLRRSRAALRAREAQPPPQA